jgi:hypothetical protein
MGFTPIQTMPLGLHIKAVFEEVPYDLAAHTRRNLRGGSALLALFLP